MLSVAGLNSDPLAKPIRRDVDSGCHIDLYRVLGLNKNCSDKDIKTAYKRIALDWHPDRALLRAPPPLPAGLTILDLMLAPRDARRDRGLDGGLGDGLRSVDEDRRRFSLAAHAYEVLSDPHTRESYDQRGHPGVARFHGDPQRTFRKCFGTDSPFLAHLQDNVHFNLEKPLPPETVVAAVPVTLEEVNKGARKEVAVAVRLPSRPDAPTVLRTFTVEVAPGVPTGMKWSFRQQGHLDLGKPPGDVELVLADVPHARFRRDGADIIQTETVSLRDALTGCTIQVVTLDHRIIPVVITDIVSPGYERRLHGEGLPTPWSSGGTSRADRGILIVRLDVLFPLSLSRPSKALLDQALQLNEHSTDTTTASRKYGRAGGGVTMAILEDKTKKQTRRKSAPKPTAQSAV